MKCLLIAISCLPLLGTAQINFQLGQALTLGNKKTSLEIIDDHYVAKYNSDYRKIGTETFFKVSSYKHWDTTKFSIQYTLQFGLKYYHHYTESSYTFDEIYQGYPNLSTGSSNYHKRSISWMNGLDLIYRFNQKMTFINTIGVKLEAINRTYKEKLWGNGGTTYYFEIPAGANPLTNPIITIAFVPQLVIHFKKISMGIHLYQDVLLTNNLINKVTNKYPEFGKVYLSNFTTFGISFMPNFYLVPNPEYVDSIE